MLLETPPESFVCQDKSPEALRRGVKVQLALVYNTNRYLLVPGKSPPPNHPLRTELADLVTTRH